MAIPPPGLEKSSHRAAWPWMVAAVFVVLFMSPAVHVHAPVLE